MYKVVYRLVYLIIYNVFVFYEIVCEGWNNLRKYILNLNENITPTAMEKIVFQSLEKRPNHITFLIDEKPSYKDLANLVIWCMTSRISFVSFYDHQGFLEKHDEELEYEVNKRKLTSDHIFWHYRKNVNFKNGFTGRKVHIKILTAEDSKKSLENLCKKLILERNPVSEITTDLIDHNLRKQYEFPDPDIGVIFSKIFMLFNYPPWQIRLTEFYRLNSHYNISLTDFTDVLRKYSKCEQRRGT